MPNSRPLRILVLCRSMPWHRAGGMENHAWDLIRGLAERGDEIHLLTTPSEKTPPPMPPRVRLHSLAEGEEGGYSIKTFRGFGREARRLDQEFHFDVIHSQGFAAFSLDASMAPRLAVTIHGTLTSETDLYRPCFRKLGAIERLRTLWRHKARIAAAPLYRRLLRRARVILVDSQFTRAELLRGNRRLNEKIHVCLLGIHPDRMPRRAGGKRLPAKPLRLLSVGRLTEAKGMDVALEALGVLGDEGWRWTLAGEGPQREALERRAGEMRLSDRIEFLGEIEEQRLGRLRAEHDLFVYPERSYPAFGLVALEAFLSDLPVVATDHGAIPEVVRPDCGWLVPADDPGAMADRLRRLIDDPARVAEVSNRCRRLALERFSFDQMVDASRKAMQEIAN